MNNHSKSLSSLIQCLTGVGDRINKINEKIVGVLILILVLDVWLGVIARYLLHWQIPWTEELARYIMIWGILLAVPCCCYRREHIGLTIIQRYFPDFLLRYVLIGLDVLAIIFFIMLSITGYTFVEKGLSQFSTIFSMPMAVPYAAIPTAFGLAAFQTALALLRDLNGVYHNSDNLGAEEL